MSVSLYQAKAEFFKTLSHPARIRILELLSERDHSVRDLLASIDIEPGNLSQQLSILRRASLVAPRRRDGEVRYSASAAGIRDLLLAARKILNELTRVEGEIENLSPAPRSPTSSQRQSRRG